MNTIAIDIGNSTTKAAVLRDGVIVWKRTAPTRDLVDAKTTWPALLSDSNVEISESVIGISSVVPRALDLLRASVPMENPVLIGGQLDLPFRMAYSTPETLGADRLAAAVAAWNRFGSVDRSVLVVDAGTAVNYEVVRASSVYLGGPIAPGLIPMRDALIGGTSRLPPIDLEPPEVAIGSSTKDALRSGIVYAFVDAVSGMIARIRAELASLESGGSMFVVLTGGDAGLLADAGVTANRIEPDLVLMGIADLVGSAAVDNGSE